jgi:hypothetical protein
MEIELEPPSPVMTWELLSTVNLPQGNKVDGFHVVLEKAAS